MSPQKELTPPKTPEARGLRAALWSLVGVVTSYLYGLWQLPGVSDYTNNFVQTQGFDLLLSLALLVGIPTGIVSYIKNKREAKLYR
jgi:hypothetical protein